MLTDLSVLFLPYPPLHPRVLVCPEPVEERLILKVVVVADVV
jgi:hypothetical protein